MVWDTRTKVCIGELILVRKSFRDRMTENRMKDMYEFGLSDLDRHIQYLQQLAFAAYYDITDLRADRDYMLSLLAECVSSLGGDLQARVVNCLVDYEYTEFK